MKTLHWNDAKVPCIAQRLRCVFPQPHEEDVRAGSSGAERLLLDAADPTDVSVERDLTRRHDAAPMIDVLAELLEHVQCKRESCGRAADTTEIDVHLPRQFDVSCLPDAIPTIARPRSLGDSTVRTVNVSTDPWRWTRSTTSLPGWTPVNDVRSS